MNPENMTIDALRTILIDVCRVRDELYAALDERAHELADLRQEVLTRTAQIEQRDARIAELEAERIKYREALSDAYVILTRERRDFKSKANAVKLRIAAIGTISDLLPFETVPEPENPDAPDELGDNMTVDDVIYTLHSTLGPAEPGYPDGRGWYELRDWRGRVCGAGYTPEHALNSVTFAFCVPVPEDD